MVPDELPYLGVGARRREISGRLQPEQRPDCPVAPLWDELPRPLPQLHRTQGHPQALRYLPLEQPRLMSPPH